MKKSLSYLSNMEAKDFQGNLKRLVESIRKDEDIFYKDFRKEKTVLKIPGTLDSNKCTKKYKTEAGYNRHEKSFHSEIDSSLHDKDILETRKCL